jgi:hypothetical protein
MMHQEVACSHTVLVVVRLTSFVQLQVGNFTSLSDKLGIDGSKSNLLLL